MQFRGLFAITYPTSDTNFTQSWLKQYVQYEYKLFDYFDDSQSKDIKYSILVNRGGGLPVVLTQDFKNSSQWINDLEIGDLGVLAFKVKLPDLRKVYLLFKQKKVPVFGKLTKTSDERDIFWLKDPSGNNFMFEQAPDNDFFSGNILVGGIYSVVIGVKDLEKSIEFFSRLGYKLRWRTHYTEDLNPLMPSDLKVERAQMRYAGEDFLLKKLLGVTELDLVQADRKGGTKLSPVQLVFQVAQTHKITEDLQFRVIDDDKFTVMYAPLEDKTNGMQHLAVDLFRLRLKNIWEWDLKKAERKNERFTINYVFENALEKI